MVGAAIRLHRLPIQHRQLGLGLVLGLVLGSGLGSGLGLGLELGLGLGSLFIRLHRLLIQHRRPQDRVAQLRLHDEMAVAVGRGDAREARLAARRHVVEVPGVGEVRVGVRV